MWLQASEGRILQALREEVADAEHRVEEERAAAAAARKASAQREHELEAAMSGRSCQNSRLLLLSLAVMLGPPGHAQGH